MHKIYYTSYGETNINLIYKYPTNYIKNIKGALYNINLIEFNSIEVTENSVTWSIISIWLDWWWRFNGYKGRVNPDNDYFIEVIDYDSWSKFFSNWGTQDIYAQNWYISLTLNNKLRVWKEYKIKIFSVNTGYVAWELYFEWKFKY